MIEILAIWLVLVLGNTIISCLIVESSYDKIFLNRNYTYEHVVNRLGLIEEYTNRDYKAIRRRLKLYLINSKKTRKSFDHFAKYIEPILLDVVTYHEGGNWNFFWRKSSLLTKVHFFFVLLVPLALFIYFWDTFMEKLPDAYIFALFPIILAVLGVAAYLLILNVFFYNFFIYFLNLFNYESGVLNRNAIAFGNATSSFKFYRKSALILWIGGSILTPMSKLTKFKGFGGGKFGGGGASGSW